LHQVFIEDEGHVHAEMNREFEYERE